MMYRRLRRLGHPRGEQTFHIARLKSSQITAVITIVQASGWRLDATKLAQRQCTIT